MVPRSSSVVPLRRSLLLLLFLPALAFLAGGSPAWAAGGMVTVHVANQYGVADAGATVSAGPPGTTVATCTLQGRCGAALGQTDAAGNLAFTPSGPGPTALCAVAPTSSLDRDVGCTDPLMLAVGATISIVPQTVPPTPFPGTQAGSGAITLRVEDQDGRPLPNAPVLLTSSGVADPTNGARPDGSLTFENVTSIAAPCACVFSYQLARFTQSGCLGPLRVAPWGSAMATLRLTPGAAAVPQMQLGAVAVTVTDPAGHPLPNVFISVAVNMDINTHYATDAKGHYIFLQPAGVPTLPVFFEPDAPYASVQLQSLTVQPGEVKQLTVTVPVASPPPASPAIPGPVRGWIDGSVFLAGTTTPVPGAVVKVAGTALASWPLPGGVYQFPALSVTSGANGGATYTVTLVPPPGYAVVGPASQTVAVTAGHGVAATFFVRPTAASASPPCRFVLGFAALHTAIPAVVGDCVDDEQHSPGPWGSLCQAPHGN